MSLTLWDTSSEEDVNINETAAKVLKTEDLTPKLPEVGVVRNIPAFISMLEILPDDSKMFLSEEVV